MYRRTSMLKNSICTFDKINSVDYHWFIVRTLPHQEKKLRDLLLEHQSEMTNILDVYCPVHTTVKVIHDSRKVDAPLFAGHVFVFSTHQVLEDFLSKYYPDGSVLYCRKDSGSETRTPVRTVPETQMRFFKDFNENYADNVIVLEHPYTDYAFNHKNNEPNEVIKVLDGPLAGHKGYLVRVNKNRRLVFNMEGLDGYSHVAISIPDIWNFHVIRLHNADGDRQTVGTKKIRTIDMLAGIIQGCGYGEDTLATLYDIIDKLTFKPSLVQLCSSLFRGNKTLSQNLAGLSNEEAGLIMYLIRYECENPGYVRSVCQRLVIRPFLTPTSGITPAADKEYATLNHPGFTEIIRKEKITEHTFFPASGVEKAVDVTYYSHIGIAPGADNGYTLFVNWDELLNEYFMTSGNARKKLLEVGFANYAPTLYQVIEDMLPVKALSSFRVGEEKLNVLAIQVSDVTDSASLMDVPSIASAVDTLISTGIKICQEINTTTHLAVWRRYLRSVWLHR